MDLEIRPGDVLVSRANTRELVGSAALVVAVRSRLLLCDKLFRLTIDVNRLDPRFFVYAVGSADVRDQVEAAATGASSSMLNIGQDTLRSIRVSVPPIERQRSIVAFLDSNTDVVDELIAKKERLAALVQERRQALIVQLATKGLDLGVLMKESGVDWIGLTPRHWDVARIKHVARLESGHTPSRAVSEHWLDTNEIPWVSLSDTKVLACNDYISDTVFRINELGLKNSSARLLPARVVVFTRDATIGKASIATRPMAVSQHVVAWVCGVRILPEYLLRVLYAMEPALERYTFGATIKTIGMDDVRELVTPVPPLDEQRAIVEVLERSSKQMEDMLNAVSKQLQRLHEYRQALITAAVTGKIDVTKERPA